MRIISGFPQVIFGQTPPVEFDSWRAGLILVYKKHFELLVKLTPVKLFRRYYLKIFSGTIWSSCVGKKILGLANETTSASAESVEIKFNHRNKCGIQVQTKKK